MVYGIKNTGIAAPLFAGWGETMIWSCLQGVMGHVYGDSETAPSSAMALLGDFCFLAGRPAEELVSYKPPWCRQEFLIMIPQSEAWAGLVEGCYGERAVRVTRYAMRKEPEVFDRERLKSAVETLPKGYALEMLDEPLFHRCRELEWCKDWVAQYEDFAGYQKHGLGVAVIKDGEPVSGASSYSGYLGGIEIQIDTREDHRRRGLAFASGAKLILECLKRGWYPGWDAQNMGSARLAQKLGYHVSHAYTAYEIRGY